MSDGDDDARGSSRTTRPYTLAQLRRLSLARQFPRLQGRGVDAVARVIERVGPMQTQTARSAFLGLAARLPGITHATLTEAYERLTLVRGSTIRGTVHTSSPQQHVWLDRATRVGQRALWARTLRLQHTSLADLWSGIEEYASGGWYSPDELRTHLWRDLDARGEQPEALDRPVSRYISFGHGGLVRRPATGGWHGQGAAVYRWIGDLLPDLAEDRAAPHEDAIAAVVRLHLASHGPASRDDIAWWSGLGLREVDAALAHLGSTISSRPGPDDREYWDLTDGVPRPVADVGTRLLPEFDALLCGYAPRARQRFVTDAQHASLWHKSNGLVRAPVLHAGRLVGWWRLDGPARARRLEVTGFPGVALPDLDDLQAPVAAACTAMGWDVPTICVAAHD